MDNAGASKPKTYYELFYVPRPGETIPSKRWKVECDEEKSVKRVQLLSNKATAKGDFLIILSLVWTLRGCRVTQDTRRSGNSYFAYFNIIPDLLILKGVYKCTYVGIKGLHLLLISEAVGFANVECYWVEFHLFWKYFEYINWFVHWSCTKRSLSIKVCRCGLIQHCK